MKQLVGMALLCLFTIQCKSTKGNGERPANKPSEEQKGSNAEEAAVAPPADPTSIASRIQQASADYGQSCDATQPVCQTAQAIAAAPVSDIAQNMVSANPSDVATVQQAIVDSLPPSAVETTTPAANSPATASAPPPVAYNQTQITGISMMVIGGLVVVGGTGAAALHAWASDYRGFRKATEEKWKAIFGQETKLGKLDYNSLYRSFNIERDSILLTHTVEDYVKSMTEAQKLPDNYEKKHLFGTETKEKFVNSANELLEKELNRAFSKFDWKQKFIAQQLVYSEIIERLGKTFESRIASIFNRMRIDLINKLPINSPEKAIAESANKTSPIEDARFDSNTRFEARATENKLQRFFERLGYGARSYRITKNGSGADNYNLDKSSLGRFGYGALAAALIGGFVAVGGYEVYKKGSANTTPTQSAPALNLAQDESLATLITLYGQAGIDAGLGAKP